ncbi:MAG: SWIM zinc finger family protein [bacterium]|nr:SWIM zinc finger family protein [bacterium]
MTMQPKDIKRLQARSRKLHARVIAPNTLIVESHSKTALNHVVTIEMDGEGTLHARCTCPWAQNGGFGCSHVLAALSHLAASKDRAISFWLSKEDAERQRHRMLHLAGDGSSEGIWITTRPERDPRHTHHRSIRQKTETKNQPPAG